MIRNNDSLGVIVRKLEKDFTSGTGTLTSKYVRTDLYEDINKVYAYLESKHISGSTDSLGREKPFFNIVIASRNIWYRATDLDRKNIRVKATKSSDILASFLATIHLQDWMRKNNFGVFLNAWGMELAGFNSTVVKFVEKDGELISSVVPWSRLICDQVNFKNNPKIEILELTEGELYEKGYDSKLVKDLVESHKARELTNKQKKDNKNNFYKLYEVHGLFPVSFLTGNEEDEDKYCQQMHVLSFMANKKADSEYNEYTLYKGKEEKDPYMLTSLLPATDGSISLDGSVKTLFESQWMVNHTAKQIKDQLDLSSKLIFQTSDGNFIGQNALSAIESGDIMIHAPNQPLTQLANNSHDITALQNFGQQWKNLGNEITGISESMMGNNAPSGTAWRQVEALLQESHSLFELMTENKGLALEEMLKTYVIPFVKKKMDNSKEISATLEGYNLERIDSKYANIKGNERFAKKIIDHILTTGNTPQIDEQMRQDEISGVKKELNEQGTQRFFKPDEVSDMTWKTLFKDLEWELEIDITGEQKDNQSDMATLATVFQTVAGLNGQPMSPEVKLLFNKILMKTGTVSPVELADNNQPQKPVNPMAGSVGTGVGELTVSQ
jgi:hypothetical protein